MKEQYDKNHTDKMPNVGSMVMLESPVIPRGHTLKLTRTYKGPYQITKVLDNTVILIDPKKPHKEPIMVHISRCKPINTDEQIDKEANDNENQPGPSQTIPTGNQKSIINPVIQTQEPTSRYPLRSRGTNVNVITMLTVMCLINTINGTTVYTREYLQKTLTLTFTIESVMQRS